MRIARDQVAVWIHDGLQERAYPSREPHPLLQVTEKVIPGSVNLLPGS
jgi:hypothetical protein